MHGQGIAAVIRRACVGDSVWYCRRQGHAAVPICFCGSREMQGNEIGFKTRQLLRMTRYDVSQTGHLRSDNERSHTRVAIFFLLTACVPSCSRPCSSRPGGRRMRCPSGAVRTARTARMWGRRFASSMNDAFSAPTYSSRQVLRCTSRRGTQDRL
ncbi:MAG: hypothetical protein FE78DRAFT_492127 [Acidomyces sp. 'richmondensis']|nr:MAG: hypothetical protein FE78DRAFT_492127 [Acidomyces sp. 'richmondensis']